MGELREQLERRAQLLAQGALKAVPAIAATEIWKLDQREFEVHCLPLSIEGYLAARALTLVVETTENAGAKRPRFWRAGFERLLTELSTQFVSSPAQATDDGLNRALERIGEFCEVDRAYIFVFDPDGRAMTNTHEWCAPSIVPQLDQLQHLPIEVFPWWTERIKRREVIRVTSVPAMPEEASAEREILERQSIRSVVVLPMIREPAIVGFLGFDSVRHERCWSDEEIALLRIVGELFVSALGRKQADLERRAMEAQLIQARSLENVARLAGGVAHDFNNLIAVILNYATLLRRELGDNSLGEYAAELLQSATQAATLTRQLMIVGRKSLAVPVVVDLNIVIQSLEGVLFRTLGESVKLELLLAPDLGLVRIGQLQVEQVIINLALNARYAMHGGGHMRIETASVQLDEREACRHIDLEPGPHVVLSVSDDGGGMDEATVAHAFDPFFTTKGTAGTGLGLSTVLGIVKEAGGQVLLESKSGQGTSVRIYLPDVLGEASPPKPPEEPSPVPLGRGERILYVEDNAGLRPVVDMVLSQAHYEVFLAKTPEEALELCEQHEGRFDLFLSDVVLPSMSGCVLAELIKERFRIPHFAYVSGYADDELARRGAMERSARLLPKPFLDADLLRFVRAALDGD